MAKAYVVDGIKISEEEGNILMEFKVDKIAHRFRIKRVIATKIAHVLEDLLETN